MECALWNAIPRTHSMGETSKAEVAEALRLWVILCKRAEWHIVRPRLA